MKSRFAYRLFAIFFALVGGLIPAAQAQYWNADDTFAPAIEAYAGTGGGVLMTPYPGGKLLINTSYDMVDGRIITGELFRLNADGTFDPAFHPNRGTTPLLSYSNGAILVATSSTNYAPYTIRRLLANGAVDSTFVGPTVNASGYALRALLLADGRTLLYGDITEVAGAAQLGLVILQNDGSVDHSFAPSLTNGAYVTYAAQTGDGHILVSGQFLKQGPTSLNYILGLNLDGSFYTAFNANAVGVPGTIYPQADGRILIGSSNKITRLSSTGAVDSTFTPSLVGMSWTFGAPKTNGEIFYLTYVGVNSQLRLMHPDGSDDSSFPAITFNYNLQPSLPTLSDDGTYFEGPLTVQRDSARFEISHVLIDGTTDPAYHPRFSRSAQINAYARQTDGKHLISGLFDYISNVSISESNGGLVRLNDDGTLDTSFVAPVGRGSVAKVAIQPTGRILVYGGMQDNHGTACNLIRLKVDGTYDDTFNPITTLYAMWLDNAGYIYFVNASSQLKRATPDGLIDATFQPVAPLSGALSMVALSDGSILIQVATDMFNSSLVRFLHDGTVDAGFAPVPVSNPVAIAGLPDGSIMVCEQNYLVAYAYYYNVRHIQPNGIEDYNYTTGGTSGNFLDRNVGLQIAGSLFDLLRAASPVSIAQVTLDFSSTTLVCRTDGQLMYYDHGSFSSLFQRWQRTALTSPSVDASPFILQYIPPSSTPIVPDSIFSGPIISVGGLSPLSYQWQKNGVPVPGQISPSLFFFSTQPSDAGTYSLVITNASGTVTTPSFDLLVDTVPVITTQPANQAVAGGSPATFIVTAGGIPSPTYQWRKNGANIAGATGSSYTIASVDESSLGSYSVVATNLMGSVTSTAAELTMFVAAPSNAVISITVQ